MAGDIGGLSAPTPEPNMAGEEDEDGGSPVPTAGGSPGTAPSGEGASA